VKNKVLRNFLIFISIWVLIIFGQNIFNHRPILTNFPWDLVLIVLLSLILVVTNLSRKAVFGIYFVIFFIYMLINGGYYNWTSLIVFAFVSVFLSAITYFIGAQFRKGENLKK